MIKRLLVRAVPLALLVGMVVPAAAEVRTVRAARLDATDTIVLGIIDDPSVWPARSDWTSVSASGTDGVVLNPDGGQRGDGPPSVATIPQMGTPIVAWARNSEAGFDLVVSWFADGVWTEPQVLAGSPDDEVDPFLTIDPDDGSVHIVYTVVDRENLQSRVMLIESAAGLGSWNPPLEVSRSGEQAMRPAAEFHAGQLSVVYEAHPESADDPPREIVLATRTEGIFVSHVLGLTYYSNPSWPQLHAGHLVVWVEWIDAADAMAWTRQVDGQVWEPVVSEPYTSIEDRDYFARGRIRGQARE